MTQLERLEAITPFVELTQEEQDNLIPPESALDCYEIVLYKDGDAK